MAPQQQTIVDESLPKLSVYQGRLTQIEENGNGTTEQQQVEAEETKEEKPWYKRAWRKWANFYAANSFLVGVVCAILLARAYPPLGADYLQPQITATWIAVIFIFLMAGLGLKTEELSKAFTRVYFNSFVQVYNFGVVSSIVFGFSRLVEWIGAIDKSLADGMVICSCLPLTVNMVLVLTKSGGGDEASAIFNAAFGNLVGVFLSPVLILLYIGVTGDVDLASVFYKLAVRVLAPLAVGQILQKTSKTVTNFVKKNKKHFKKLQEWTLIFIVYTVFCRTFEDGSSSGIGDVMLMILFQFILLCIVMALAWFLLRFLFRNDPKLRVMGLFGCTHKTVAMGVPLINAIYEADPNVGLYTLPLLIWHPMQLVIGSALAPRLAAFVKREEERLGIAEDDESHEVDVTPPFDEEDCRKEEGQDEEVLAVRVNEEEEEDEEAPPSVDRETAVNSTEEDEDDQL